MLPASSLYKKPPVDNLSTTVANEKERLLVTLVKEITEEEGYDLSLYSGQWMLALTEPTHNQTQYILGYNFELNNQVGGEICDDKAALSDILDKAHIPHVQHKIFVSPQFKAYVRPSGTMTPLFAFAEQHQNDIVLKPKDGSGGQGVVRCKNRRELESAMIDFCTKDLSFLATPFEEIITEYRVIYLAGEAKLIYSKNRPTVTGNGELTMRELLIGAFAQNPDLLDLIKDPDNFANLDLSYKPRVGEVVPVMWKHNLGKGATAALEQDAATVEVLTKLSHEAAQAANMNFVSVDIIKVKNNEANRQATYTTQNESGDYAYKVIEINSGVMMEKMTLHIPNGREIAKEIYREAIKKRFNLELVNQHGVGASTGMSTPALTH